MAIQKRQCQKHPRFIESNSVNDEEGNRSIYLNLILYETGVYFKFNFI